MEIIHRADLIKMLGISRAWLIGEVNKGTFPAPFNLGPKTVVWDRADVDSWLEEKKNGGSHGTSVRETETESV